MRQLTILAAVVLFLTLAMTCQKKALPIDEGISTSNDTLSYSRTDRDDVPPPPEIPWWTLDTTNLDTCQQRLWGYLRTMYPTREDDYWGYETYAIMGEPEGVFEHRDFVGRYLHFFIDTIYSKRGMLNDPANPCMNVDTTFFLQALGPPTCISQHVSGHQTTYFYNFKMRYRSGPCPYIFNEGHPLEWRCDVQHLEYCALLMVMFAKQEGGRMTYISFYGPGG